ncbi:MAG TPA: CDP-alcohol phosphatidyltransferase family protein, partial [Caldithrix sp.]|nr:CDP-alcohol phosphatidyltransferase family protein [Caldithrix sp.]
MAANIITLGRIVLVFLVILLFQAGFYIRLIAVALTILVIWLDSLDGYVARKLGVASDFGALFDITGDRIVEHIY